jgi:hypothetical protein
LRSLTTPPGKLESLFPVARQGKSVQTQVLLFLTLFNLQGARPAVSTGIFLTLIGGRVIIVTHRKTDVNTFFRFFQIFFPGAYTL